MEDEHFAVAEGFVRVVEDGVKLQGVAGGEIVGLAWETDAHAALVPS